MPLVGGSKVASKEFKWAISMLDWESPDSEDPSEQDSGGVSAPELLVTVLDREREAGPGREKTVFARTEDDITLVGEYARIDHLYLREDIRSSP